MQVIHAYDVNKALEKGLQLLFNDGVVESSRNGKVLVAPGPVTTTYVNPTRRVLLSPTRDANPWFHFFESIWMLHGDEDIEFPVYFNSTYGQFSDDGKTMWDAYGYRWRKFFGWDQLKSVIDELKRNPTSRRCVIAMWNAAVIGDLPTHRIDTSFTSSDDLYIATHGGKAVPCNTHCYVDLRGGKLHLTVCCRSNDAIWGAYGANAVHFSYLQEYLAAQIGVPVGRMEQVSHNLHLYLDKFSLLHVREMIAESRDLELDIHTEVPAISKSFDESLNSFMFWARECIKPVHGADEPLNIPHVEDPVILGVAIPMFLAWYYRKQKDEHAMHVCLGGIQDVNWQRACTEWVERRTK